MATTEQKTLIGVAVAIGAYLAYRSKPLTATVTTSEGFDLSEYGGPVTYPQSIKTMATAIARAEGFYVSGSIPQRANNPGDLKQPGWDGPTLGNGISVFQSVDAGWNALYKQLWLIVTGRSSYYTLDDTIADMANNWTATQQDSWATNVAGWLGVTPETRLWEVLG